MILTRLRSMAMALALPSLLAAAPRWGGELRFCLRSDPRTFNPILVDEDSGETVRYLSGGVLLRVNRITQELEPELARSWKLAADGRAIEFELREGVRYSDGTPLEAADVAFTMRALLDPAVHSPTGDSFRSGAGGVETSVPAHNRVRICFRRPVAGLARLFDQVAILNARALERAARPAEMPVLGPYRVAEYKSGAYLVLTRNPYYWKTDASGRRLPYIDAIRLSIQPNRELELLRFERGELDLIHGLDPDAFERLARRDPRQAADVGPSLNWEQIWFNLTAAAPLAAYKKEWFQAREFRRAIWEAINRDDICRVVYRRRAVPATAPISPANRLWFDARLEPLRYDPRGALERLRRLGFRMQNQTLVDRHGNVVEFSVVTNGGNKMRERIAAMVQQDLGRLGIRLNVVTLDFASLLERVTRSFRYEACLLGLVNIEADPNGLMSLWLSSADNHAWNPRQTRPETSWEAEIDRLMLAQSAESSTQKRKALFDRVQEIAWEQAPVLYLVNPNRLCAISPRVRQASPAPLYPHTYWNIERLYLAESR